MATYLELQEKVLRNVIDQPQAVQDAVPGLINEALTDIQSRHDFEVMKALLEATSADATRNLVAKPSNWLKPRGRPYWVPFGLGKDQRFDWAPNKAWLSNRTTEQVEGAPHWLLMGVPSDEAGTQQIELWPLSDGYSDYSDGQYRIKIPYWRTLTALSASGSSNWFTVNTPLYLEYRATASAFAIDWDEERMTLWNARAEGEFNKVRTRDKLQRLGGWDTLSVSLDAED